jgi:4-oxalmesaconate hydratase
VFEDFPELKIVVSHTGGAIPFHMGRFRAWRSRSGGESFDVSMRRLYYDTCNYSKEALDFTFKVLGTDRCLFGTEKPGTGTALNHETGLMYDDLKPVIESIEWLTENDKKQIFEDNARKVYNL